MIEPALLANFFTIFFSSAMVILLGALYALLFAFSRIKGERRLMPLAYLSYAGLVVATLTLAQAANLLKQPFWFSIVLLMLLGYLLAPHGIWHLCVSTHADEAPRDSAIPNSKQDFIS
ncbi:MAG: hypothetical protein PHW66_07500 [Gallionella sp.]|nr:hypothetical protein [Gallionella sp.]